MCHPGLDFESSDRKPYILHLDSMEGVLSFITFSGMQRSCSPGCVSSTSTYCNCTYLLQLHAVVMYCNCLVFATTNQKECPSCACHTICIKTQLACWSCHLFSLLHPLYTAATCCKTVLLCINHCLKHLGYTIILAPRCSNCLTFICLPCNDKCSARFHKQLSEHDV